MLKAILESLDGLDQAEAQHYKQGEDGQYMLDVGAVAGMALSNVEGIQGTLNKVREEKKVAEKRLKSFGDLDPTVAREAMGRVTDLETQLGGKDEDLEVRVQNAVKGLETKHKEQLNATQELVGAEADKANGYLQQLREANLGRSISDAIVKNGGNPVLLPAVIRNHVRFADAESVDFEVVNDKGEALYAASGPRAGLPMDLDEFVGSLRDNKDYADGFKGSGASGTGGKGSDASGSGGGGVNPFAADSFNLTEQGRITRSNPAEAKRLMAQADQA